jgi:hypothetical protein
VPAATGVSVGMFDAMHLSVYDGRIRDLSDFAGKVSLQRVRLWCGNGRCSRRAERPDLPGRVGRRAVMGRLVALAVRPGHRLVLASYCPECPDSPAAEHPATFLLDLIRRKPLIT